jgi:anaerobic selenocysteine-containing dehydrogenase
MNENGMAKSAKRRDFLKLIGLGSLAGAASVVAAKPAAAVATATTATGQGYRETEHVKTYYRTARF